MTIPNIFKPQMPKRLRQAIKNVLSTNDGAIVIAWILQTAGVHSAQKEAEDLHIQQFGIKIMGMMDLYTTRGDFPLRHVKALVGLPRSEDVKKTEEDLDE